MATDHAVEQRRLNQPVSGDVSGLWQASDIARVFD